ncbi:MAG TPA: flavodoxin family protein [candidate division Zixibacteria bacterium]|nr:flavodoxin family protein [candidate division Zixibacteria bacterium]MDD4918289.1 flavodoxin family protein [candidate division Zixibacteria bacterium]MDM7973188.1 flavodoxin family protein [candidate division Zixibacteria bacterium]HOD65868.1 flavodoxin family protein [candidate division Zixibacteria bacterium]HOZ08373.1 flavodoxin family protein [candidate division Zixibacteria bacterium]
MISLLVISGSPVPGASTDILLRQAADAVRRGLRGAARVRTTFVKLNDLRILPCQACGEAPTPQFCFFDDDMAPLYRELARCDCLLFGSPIHFDTVSSQAKLFIDRCNCVRPADFRGADPDHGFLKLIARKRPGAMVLVSGERQWTEGARRVIAGFFKWAEVTNEGLLTYRTRGLEAGEAAGSAAALAEADALGHRLAGLLRRRCG